MKVNLRTQGNHAVTQYPNPPPPPLATPKYHCNAVALSRALIHILPAYILPVAFQSWFPVHGYTQKKIHIPVRTPKWPPRLIFAGACHGQ